MHPRAPASARRPRLALLGLEPLRATLEYVGLRRMDRTRLPTGDGHPVIVFPGLAADPRSLAPLIAFCRSLGYPTRDWGRGFNAGPRGDVATWLDELAAHVDALAGRRAPSLIGWSLGGIYAREVARVLGRRVRQVITIGTPFAGTPAQTHAGWVYRLVNGAAPAGDAALGARLRRAPPVPTTSIYSRGDGVVAWQACVQRGRAPQAENIEVAGSHCGLGWNAQVLAIVADRLAQPEGRWRRHPAARGAAARPRPSDPLFSWLSRA